MKMNENEWKLVQTHVSWLSDCETETEVKMVKISGIESKNKNWIANYSNLIIHFC